jgi:glycosyltransferase involved in cell wall biosynthesis
MDRLRVLHLIWRLSRGGGIPRVARDLLTGIDRERFDVHVSSVRSFYPQDGIEELGPGLTLHTLGVDGRTTILDEIRIARAAADLARRVQPDILHLHSSGAMYTALPGFPNRRIKGKVMEIHDAPQSRRRGRLSARLYRWMTRRLGYRMLVHSSAVRDGVAEACRIPAGEITLIPLGIETARYARAETPRAEWRRQYGIAADAPVVVYVARLVPIKNIPLFIQVAREVLETVPTAYFLVSGGGPMREALQRVIDGYGLQDRVRLLGFQESLADVYHAADVFLSTSDYEGFGLAIVEAMASGLPVVATRVGGVVDPIQDGRTGCLCPSGDRAALAAATIELLRDPARRRQLGEAGLTRAVQLFDVQAMVRQFEELYVATVRDAQPARSPVFGG